MESAIVFDFIWAGMGLYNLQTFLKTVVSYFGNLLYGRYVRQWKALR